MAPAWKAGEAKALAGSSPVPSADRQGCAPGRAACLQSRRQRVRLLPPLLTVSVAEQPGTDLPRRTGGCDSRRTLFRPVTQRVWRPACRAGETGSSPVQGASSGRSRAARRPSDTRWKAGSTPAGPTDWGMDWRRFQRGLMSPPGRFDSGFPDFYSSVEQPGVLAALTSRRSLVQIQPGLLDRYPRSPAATAPP